MFNLRNRPGELVNALRAFEAHGVNLMMIESRPAQRATFEYIFYCDCAGHRTDEAPESRIEPCAGTPWRQRSWGLSVSGSTRCLGVGCWVLGPD